MRRRLNGWTVNKNMGKTFEFPISEFYRSVEVLINSAFTLLLCLYKMPLTSPGSQTVVLDLPSSRVLAGKPPLRSPCIIELFIAQPSQSKNIIWLLENPNQEVEFGICLI